MARPVWTGAVAFGLVNDITSRSLPVRARVNIFMTPPTRF